MSEPALRPITLDEFLRWDDGTDTRYELIGGFPVAMAPPAPAHGIIAARIVARLEEALRRRRPCLALVEAGILHPNRADTFFVADIAVTCAPYHPGDQSVGEPLLLVEVLSPSTERHDRRIKLPAYQRIGSLQEIVLIDRDMPFAELYRRQGDFWTVQSVQGTDSMLPLASIGVEISIAELYEGITSGNDIGGLAGA
ncbi:MAG TPA: Uma2 family endonuclease [Stellaceae bacterium]|nr:Uma2 family endonuclease [Stellaceae bacterium]